jgi:hypothetical protein
LIRLGAGRMGRRGLRGIRRLGGCWAGDGVLPWASV